VLQPSDHLCGPPVDLLQELHVLLVLGSPELEALVQVGSHQSGVEMQNHLARPADHASFDAAQDTVGLLGCKSTFLSYVQVFIHLYPQVLFDRTALHPFIPQPVLIVRVFMIQMQDLALGLVDPHEVHIGPLLELVQVLLDGISSLRCVDCITQLDVICKFTKVSL